MVICRRTAYAGATGVDAAEVFVLGKGILQAKLHCTEVAPVEAPPIPDRYLIDRLDLAYGPQKGPEET